MNLDTQRADAPPVPVQPAGRPVALRALRLLSRTGIDILAAPAAIEPLRRLCDGIAGLLDLDFYFFLHHDSQIGEPELRLRLSSTLSAEDAAAFAVLPLHAGDGKAVEVLTHLQQRDDAATEPLRRLGLRACARYPLRVEGRSVGLLIFGSRLRNAFEPETLAVLAAASAQMALAVHGRIGASGADRTLGDSVAALAHGLRSPLAAIRYSVEILRRDSRADTTRDQTLEVISRQVGQMKRLVDGLHDTTQAGANPPTPPSPAPPPAAFDGRAATGDPAPPLAEAPALDRHRVLVVDDNQDAAASVAMLLELEGQTVRVAHDGPSAVRETEAFEPQLVFMDLGLSGFDGLEATRRIRRLPMRAQPLIAALTGWGESADRASTRAAGFDAHLVKPVVFASMRDLLLRLPA